MRIEEYPALLRREVGVACRVSVLRCRSQLYVIESKRLFRVRHRQMNNLHYSCNLFLQSLIRFLKWNSRNHQNLIHFLINVITCGLAGVFAFCWGSVWGYSLRRALKSNQMRLFTNRLETATLVINSPTRFSHAIFRSRRISPNLNLLKKRYALFFPGQI